MQLTLAKLL